MKYIADVLTGVRILLGLIIIVPILKGAWLLATVMLLVGVLSDAFDGIAARRWPYSDEENSRLFWRQNAHGLDNIGDTLLVAFCLAGLVIRVPAWRLVAGGVVAGTLILVVLVNLMRPAVAEKIDVFYGWLYGLLLVAMLVQVTVLATGTPWAFVAAVYLVLATGLVGRFKWDRAISRPEIQYKGKW